MSLHPLLAENSLFEFIGKIFHPVFEFFGWILAGLYAIWPNYGFAITGLTILIMLALTPVTVKSTKSMIAMQRLQPEMKKLQAKYKGAENREVLNQEMMRLYKENGTSPFGACLPSLLQMPFLIVLYSLIRGLSSTVSKGATYITATGQKAICHSTCAAPKYIPTTSQMHSALVQSKGQMHWWFGMDLSSYPFSTHTSPGSPSQAVLVLPYLALIGAAMFLQYFQMKQMNSRNPQAAAANPQMQTMQKFFPIIFGVIYLRVPAGATIYMVVSSAMRIATQEVMFRTGMVTPVAAEREIGASGGASKDEKAPDATKAVAAKPKQPTKRPTKQPAKPPTKQPTTAVNKSSTATDGTSVAKATMPPRKPATPSGSGKGSSSNGRAGGSAGASTNGGGSSSDEAAPKPHPRSRSKRTRKAR
jgi:YidC/Oxa1 family membrane protein insertase